MPRPAGMMPWHGCCTFVCDHIPILSNGRGCAIQAEEKTGAITAIQTVNECPPATGYPTRDVRRDVGAVVLGDIHAFHVGSRCWRHFHRFRELRRWTQIDRSVEGAVGAR